MIAATSQALRLIAAGRPKRPNLALFLLPPIAIGLTLAWGPAIAAAWVFNAVLVVHLGNTIARLNSFDSLRYPSRTALLGARWIRGIPPLLWTGAWWSFGLIWVIPRFEDLGVCRSLVIFLLPFHIAAAAALGHLLAPRTRTAWPRRMVSAIAVVVLLATLQQLLGVFHDRARDHGGFGRAIVWMLSPESASYYLAGSAAILAAMLIWQLRLMGTGETTGAGWSLDPTVAPAKPVKLPRTRRALPAEHPGRASLWHAGWLSYRQQLRAAGGRVRPNWEGMQAVLECGLGPAFSAVAVLDETPVLMLVAGLLARVPLTLNSVEPAYLRGVDCRRIVRYNLSAYFLCAVLPTLGAALIALSFADLDLQRAIGPVLLAAILLIRAGWMVEFPRRHTILAWTIALPAIALAAFETPLPLRFAALAGAALVGLWGLIDLLQTDEASLRAAARSRTPAGPH